GRGPAFGEGRRLALRRGCARPAREVPMRHIDAIAKLLALLVAAGTATAHAEPRSPQARRNVAIVVYDDVEILDFAGPTEVFTAAGDFSAFRVYTVGPSHKPILSQGILKVIPDYSIEDAPAPDILVLP